MDAGPDGSAIVRGDIDAGRSAHAGRAPSEEKTRRKRARRRKATARIDSVNADEVDKRATGPTGGSSGAARN
jgi:hypothetical protein